MVPTELMIVWMGLAVVSAVSLAFLFFDSKLEKFLMRKIARVWNHIKSVRFETEIAKAANSNVRQEENNDCRARSG